MHNKKRKKNRDQQKNQWQQKRIMAVKVLAVKVGIMAAGWRPFTSTRHYRLSTGCHCKSLLCKNGFVRKRYQCHTDRHAHAHKYTHQRMHACAPTFGSRHSKKIRTQTGLPIYRILSEFYKYKIHNLGSLLEHRNLSYILN